MINKFIYIYKIKLSIRFSIKIFLEFIIEIFTFFKSFFPLILFFDEAKNL